MEVPASAVQPSDQTAHDISDRRKSLQLRRSGACFVCICEHTGLRACRVTLGFVTGNRSFATLMLTVCMFLLWSVH